MVECVFCGRETPFHEGVHLIKNDGSIQFYCSSKCRKNAIKLGRDRRKIKWTAAYRVARAVAAAKAEAKAAGEKHTEKTVPKKSKKMVSK
jgi:large subunit ribosomal protein L24e